MVVATGYGEDILRFSMSSSVLDRMRRGMTAQEACDDVIQSACRRRPTVGTKQTAVMAIRNDGLYGAASTTMDFPAQFLVDGQLISVTC